MATPSEQRATRARERAAMNLEEAAKALRVTAAYLRQCERSGFPYPLAARAAALYGCSMTEFLKARKETGRERLIDRNRFAVAANARQS